MKIVTVIGARPQFIKAAVVSRAFAENTGVHEIIVHTGQHFDANMSAVFFDELQIPKPHHHLGIGGGSHGQNTGRMIESIEQVLQAEKPDALLVYGDTDSTLAGALAAVKLHIPVAHVEAGLRSFNRRMPEEINRVLTDHVSRWLFAPTQTASKNLMKEGIAPEFTHVIGDVMYDAALYYTSRALAPAAAEFLQDKAFVLCTIHRAENTDSPERLHVIFEGLAKYAGTVVLPLHPRTRKQLLGFGIVPAENIILIDPVGYLEMVWLEAHCRLIATDSGGVQKEAYFHGKPCITLRTETEWVELLDAGVNRLVAIEADAIAEAMHWMPALDFSQALYGRGDAAALIVNCLTNEVAACC